MHEARKSPTLADCTVRRQNALPPPGPQTSASKLTTLSIDLLAWLHQRRCLFLERTRRDPEEAESLVTMPDLPPYDRSRMTICQLPTSVLARIFSFVDNEYHVSFRNRLQGCATCTRTHAL